MTQVFTVESLSMAESAKNFVDTESIIADSLSSILTSTLTPSLSSSSSSSSSSLSTAAIMINNDQNENFTKNMNNDDNTIELFESISDFTVQNIIYSILYSTVSLAAIGGNGIVIYLIVNFRRNRRSVTDLFILNLAIGDLLMAILCIPFTFTANLLFHAWPFGSLMCRLVSYAQAVFVFISAYTLVAISIDRYIAIIYPLRPRMTKRHSQYLVLFVWIVALLTPLPTALLSRLMLQSSSTSNIDHNNNNIMVVDIDQTNVSHSLSSSSSPISFVSTVNSTFKSNNDQSLQQSNNNNNEQYSNDLDGINESNEQSSSLLSFDLSNILSTKILKHSEIVKLKNSSLSNENILWMTKESESFVNNFNDNDNDNDNDHNNNNNNAFICQEDWNNNQEYRTSYSVLLMILQYILPFTVLVFTYTRIGLMIWGRQTPGERDGGRDARIAASKRKMVKMMITCVVAFTLCWLPLNIFIIIGDHYPDIYQYDHIEYVWVACHWLAMSHASYNPFIYIWMNQRFRNGFRFINNNNNNNHNRNNNNNQNDTAIDINDGNFKTLPLPSSSSTTSLSTTTPTPTTTTTKSCQSKFFSIIKSNRILTKVLLLSSSTTTTPTTTTTTKTLNKFNLKRKNNENKQNRQQQQQHTNNSNTHNNQLNLNENKNSFFNNIGRRKLGVVVGARKLLLMIISMVTTLGGQEIGSNV
ncbi:Neuropeptide Y receptor [Dermatophagoides pteronyssinus]|uniref:Neuropeptide Y receptor n=1 Tax=Dermatophagoides pteronyssinus TaxID=6956 RepID=A0ABQ8J5K5_DERPT|nr:Neuropeptide Y receptor [Dermatophagoides pteronyssinus]